VRPGDLLDDEEAEPQPARILRQGTTPERIEHPRAIFLRDGIAAVVDLDLHAGNGAHDANADLIVRRGVGHRVRHQVGEKLRCAVGIEGARHVAFDPQSDGPHGMGFPSNPHQE